MQIAITGRKMPITPKFRQQIERKVRRLSRLVDEDARVEVTVTEEQTRSANDRYTLQLAVADHGHPVHSEVSAVSATAALDLALDKVETQLVRQKDRVTTKRRHHTTPIKVLALSRAGVLSPLEEEAKQAEEAKLEAARNEAIWSQVSEIRRTEPEMMTTQEAIEQMEQDDSSFYLFFNEASNSLNVIYRLEDGSYGLLLPVMI